MAHHNPPTCLSWHCPPSWWSWHRPPYSIDMISIWYRYHIIGYDMSCYRCVILMMSVLVRHDIDIDLLTMPRANLRWTYLILSYLVLLYLILSYPWWPIQFEKCKQWLGLLNFRRRLSDRPSWMLTPNPHTSSSVNNCVNSFFPSGEWATILAGCWFQPLPPPGNQPSITYREDYMAPYRWWWWRW